MFFLWIGLINNVIGSCIFFFDGFWLVFVGDLVLVNSMGEWILILNGGVSCW